MTEETQATVETDGNDTAAVMAALQGDKTYIGEPKAEEAEETLEDPGEDAAAAETDEGEGEQPPKPRRSAQERINEAIRAQRDAERDRDFYREQAMRNQPQQPKQNLAPAAEAEPDPDRYEYGLSDAQFIEDRAVYRARKEFQAEQAAAKQAEEAEKQRTAFQARHEAARAKRPDFDDVVGPDFANTNRHITQDMAVAMNTSDDGPELAYHLAQNPTEARRIAALSPYAQVMELGKLAEKLAAPAVISPKTATDAPEPAPTLRGAGGRFKVAGDTQDFAAFEAQYKLGG